MPVQEAKKTNAQHAIPQNFMDVEFKIIGSLTMRQFVYLLVFFGLAYAIYSLSSSPARIVVVLLLVFSGLGLAFVPLEERGLDEWMVNFFRSIYAPSQRVWRKEPEILSPFMDQNLNLVRQELITLAPTSSRRKLEEYLHSRDSVETKPDVLDIPEAYYTEKARSAFIDEVSSVQAPESGPKSDSKEPKVKKESEEKGSAKGIPFQKQPSSDEGREKVDEVKTVKEEITSPVDSRPEVKDKKKRKFTSPPRRSEIALSPLTPDRHSGRRFVDLTPGRGHIVLPIRGEKTIRTSEELDDSSDAKEKAEQLKQLLSQLKAGAPEAEIKLQTPQDESKKEGMFRDMIQLQTEVKQEESKESEQYKPVIENKPEPTASAPVSPVEVKHEPMKQMAAASPLEVPEVDTPNVLYGVVKDPAGKIIPNVVLIVKDDSGAPVRAIKTNSLGQFGISSPLSDGKYTVEVDSTKKTGFSFDIISVPLVGGVLPPIEVVGK